MNELRKYILKTDYKKSVDCIVNMFDRRGITDLIKLQNAPSGGHICNCDIYKLVSQINEVAKNWVEKPVRKEEKSDE